MRFLKIAYRRFGPFGNVFFDVSQGDCGLHVFFGPNEAGKSTALRGLKYLLFGFPQRRCDDFRHDAREQALEASLRNSRGEELYFVRVRGRNQLRSADGSNGVSQAQLNAFLGNLTLDQFEMLFGLDHALLLKGKEEIVQGKGSLGEALFAAGAGLAGLRHRDDLLVQQSNYLYRPRANNPAINQLLSSIAQTEERQRQAVLQVETWRDQVEIHRKAAERKDELERRRREVRTDIERTTQCLTALPAIRQRLEALEDLRNLPPRDPILDEESAIGELRETLGACLKADRDRAQLVQQSKEEKDLALALLRTHFQREDLEHARELCPSAAMKRRIQELAREHQASWEAHESARAERAQRAEQVADCERRCAEVSEPPDINQLESLCNSISGEGPLEQQARRAEARLAELGLKAESLMNRLESCWRGSLEDAAALRPPPEERIAEYSRDFAQLDEEGRELDRTIEELKKTIRTADRAIQRLEQVGSIPDEAALIEARADRDAGVQLLAVAARDPSQLDRRRAESFIASHAPGGDLADAVQKSIEHCDALADRLRQEAQRVAERDAQQHRRAEAAAELEQRQQRQDEQQRKVNSLRDQWRAEWRSCGIEPREPAEMAGWLRTHAQLLDLAAEIRGGEVEARQLRERIESARCRLLAALELGADTPSQPLSELLELGRRRIAAVQQQVKSRCDLESQLAEARRRLLEAEQAVTAAEARVRKWAADWREAIRGLGAEHEAPPEAIQIRLEQLDEILLRLRRSGELDQRVSGIDQDREIFLRRLNELRARLDPGCPISTAATMQSDVDALDARLKRAREIDIRRGQRQAEADRLRRELLEHAGTQPLDEFCREILSQADSLSSRLSELRDREQTLDAEISALSETAGRAKNQLETWERADCEAALLRQERAELLARLRRDVLQYAALCLARSILHRAVESFRQRRQDSMLDRASKYFRMLTCDAFARLEVDQRDDGNLVLVAVRAASEGQPSEYVGVDGLSDGTRDQLFLALRLAGVEQHLAQCEPMPVIVDDILVNFDNQRAAATLRCLAELSKKTQVLLFTHHEHLVELARQEVSSVVLFCHAF